jgi:hypothetical protein
LDLARTDLAGSGAARPQVTDETFRFARIVGEEVADRR